MIENNKTLSQEFINKSGEIYDLLYSGNYLQKVSENKTTLRHALEQLSLDGNIAFMDAVKENSSPTLLNDINENNKPIASSLSHAFVHPATNIRFMMSFLKKGALSEKEALETLSPLRRAIADTIHNLEIIFVDNQNKSVDKFISDHKKTLEIINPLVDELSTKLNIDPATIDDVNNGCEHLNPIEGNSFHIG